MTTRSALIAMLWLVPAAASAQPATGARLSLETAIRLALDHNRQLASSALQLQKAEADLAVQRTRKRPTFETSFSTSQLLTPVGFMFPQGAFGDIPGVGPFPTTDTKVTSPQQPTFNISAQATQPLTQLKRSGSGSSRPRPAAISSASGCARIA